MKTLDCDALVGRHVSLLPLDPSHAKPLLEAANEGRRTLGLTFVPADLPEMERSIVTLLAEKAAGTSVPFVVQDARGQVVGATRYMAIEWWEWPGDPPPPLPVGPDVLEIGGTWYAERVQRTALNTEAKLLLCRHAFETWRVRRIMWKTDARNERSRNAIQRLGARFDGVLRANRTAPDNKVRDTAYFSMLASEWPEARAGLLRRLERG